MRLEGPKSRVFSHRAPFSANEAVWEGDKRVSVAIGYTA